MLNCTEKTIGIFKEKSTGNWFSYLERKHTNNFAPIADYPHIIDVLDGTRFARVLKTVAYIIVDEENDGTPVVEKWSIKRYTYIS